MSRTANQFGDGAKNKLKKELDTDTQCVYSLNMKMNNNTAKVKKQIVKILGYSVTVGSKKHALLVWQVKHFNDLANN